MISETFKTESEAREAIRKAQGQDRTGYVLRYRDDFFEARHWPRDFGLEEWPVWSKDETTA